MHLVSFELLNVVSEFNYTNVAIPSWCIFSVASCSVVFFLLFFQHVFRLRRRDLEESIRREEQTLCSGARKSTELIIITRRQTPTLLLLSQLVQSRSRQTTEGGLGSRRRGQTGDDTRSLHREYDSLCRSGTVCVMQNLADLLLCYVSLVFSVLCNRFYRKHIFCFSVTSLRELEILQCTGILY